MLMTWPQVFSRTWVPAAIALLVLSGSQQSDLPSWNAGATRTAILNFVGRVTTAGGPDFVPVAERIAVFDNDGTLWPEQPMYFQFLFAFDRVKALAPGHPEWKTQAPFDAVLAGDMKALAASGEKGMVDLLIATQTGMSTEEYAATVAEWLRTAKHPTLGRLYTDLVYQPMLELLAYLRAHDFKTFIVSGGTVEFMRVWSDRVYGIPPEQVVGTTFVTTFQMDAAGKPWLLRNPKVDFVDDGPGKPVAINKFIGRRPIAAFGNSDGDLEMLQWTTAGPGVRLGLLVHHTDAVREWAYDRESKIGRLDKALDIAGREAWTVLDMKDDWKVIYPFQKTRRNERTGGTHHGRSRFRHERNRQ
jgi:phosphoglycolate phosphatase-like HAD superfamily hydrolase